MYKNILFISLLLITIFSNAQVNDQSKDTLDCKRTISGYIINNLTNEPIFGAQIQVIDNNGRIFDSIITTSIGYYELTYNCNTRFSIRVFKEGFIDEIEIVDPTKRNNQKLRGDQNENRLNIRLSQHVERSNVDDSVSTLVYFSTNRNYNEENEVNERFGDNNSLELSYGFCDVSIPLNHEVGIIERPKLWKFEISEDPKKHIVIRSINLLEKNSFFNQINYELSSENEKKSFVFIHGFNVSFAESARRTAQIAYDLQFQGIPIFFSWPSVSSILSYKKDENRIKNAEGKIKRFLIDYLDKSGSESIYLIAHSMGSRGLTEALLDLTSERPDLIGKIKEIILAAPDIDSDTFKYEIAPQMVSKINTPITLYVSSNDYALNISNKFNGDPRAGDSHDEIMLVKGIETIDASEVKSDFLGHSYYGESSILNDMIHLIKFEQRADSRPNLKPKEMEKKFYWEF